MKTWFLVFPIITFTLTGCSLLNPVTETSQKQESNVIVEKIDESWTRSAENEVTKINEAETVVNNQVEKVTSDIANNYHIPRHKNGKPDYSKIEKGTYTKSTYTVQRGDTMYLVSYLSGVELAEIARLNNMIKPYHLRVGDILKVK